MHWVYLLITKIYDILYARIFITVLDEMPQLHQLQRLSRDNDVINVIKAVAPSWEKFALYLTMDSNMIDIWKRDAYQVEDAAMKLFDHWLKGNGRQPISWKTLIQALHENDLSIIATKVEEILTGHSGEISQLRTDTANTNTIHNAYSVLNIIPHACAPTQCMHALIKLLMGHFNMILLYIQLKRILMPPKFNYNPLIL